VTIDGYGCAGASNVAYGLVMRELERCAFFFCLNVAKLINIGTIASTLVTDRPPVSKVPCPCMPSVDIFQDWNVIERISDR
jgi:hypothetical protein